MVCIHFSPLDEASCGQVEVVFSCRLQKRHSPVPSNQTALSRFWPLLMNKQNTPRGMGSRICCVMTLWRRNMP